MINILYSDNDIVVCLKPSGVPSTDCEGGMPGLIRDEMQNNTAEVFTVHRLDQNVSGIMVYALNKSAASHLSSQISNRTFTKEYLAVVEGVPDLKEGRLDDLLFRDKEKNKTYVVDSTRKGVREASLEYKVLNSSGGLSIIRINLITGRTHQIRAQFSSRKMPLVGDKKYGSSLQNETIALWSYHLTFIHPISGESMDFIQLPPDLYPWNTFDLFDSELSLPSERIYKCEFSENCGGCKYINEKYDKSLKNKQEYLNNLFCDYSKVQPVIGMKDPYHYRNKVNAVYFTDRKGSVLSGRFMPDSHRIVPVNSCLIEDDIADKIICTIQKMVKDYRLTTFDNASGKNGFLRYILIRRSISTKEIMVTIVASSTEFKSKNQFIKDLIKQFPDIRTVVLNINDKYTSAVLGKEFHVLYGDGYITDIIDGIRFRISPGAFYQVNNKLTESLYKYIIQNAEFDGNEKLLDAYCGTGTIGIFCSSHVNSVIGVELNKSAVKDAIYNCKSNDIHNCRFYCDDATDFMCTAASINEYFNVVIVDPPRSGCSNNFLVSLNKLRPDKIIYVSCNPDTLCRDLKQLSNNYNISLIQPFDMFPFTEHVETVVLLSRA